MINLIPSPDHDVELSKRGHLSIASRRPELSSVSVVALGEKVRLRGQVPSFHLRQVAIKAAKDTPGWPFSIPTFTRTEA